MFGNGSDHDYTLRLSGTRQHYILVRVGRHTSQIHNLCGNKQLLPIQTIMLGTGSGHDNNLPGARTREHYIFLALLRCTELASTYSQENRKRQTVKALWLSVG